MPLKLEKAAREGRAFLNLLSRQLGHAGETGQTFILVKAALHALRNRISTQQSLHLMAQLPIFMKVIYVEGWKYRDQPEKIDTREEFVEYVKVLQYRYGEYQFDWPEPTAESITVIYNALRRFVNEGEIQKIVAELPRSLKSFFEPRKLDQPEVMETNEHFHAVIPGLGNDAVFKGQDPAYEEDYNARPPARQAIYLDDSMPSDDLFEEERLNEAQVGVGGGGAMGSTSGGTLEPVGGGPRNITQGKGYNTLGIGARSKSIVSHSLQGHHQEVLNSGSPDQTPEDYGTPSQENTDTAHHRGPDAADSDEAPNTDTTGNKRAGGTLREKTKGILGTGEKADSGIGNA